MAADEPKAPSGQSSELRNPFTGQTIRFVEEAGTVRWEVRPPLRTREFFLGLFAALQAASDGVAEPEPFDFADFAAEFQPA